jgi:hypothetical protein
MMAVIWNGTEHVIRRGGVEVKTLPRADFGGTTPDTASAKSVADAALVANERSEGAYIHIERDEPLSYRLLIARPDSPRFAAASQLGLAWWECPPAAQSNPGGAR